MERQKKSKLNERKEERKKERQTEGGINMKEQI